jgi:hypothetical protein
LNLNGSRLLKSIGARVFSGLSKLKKLDLSECGIEFIHPDAFDDSQEIEFLNLESNGLKKFVTKCSPKKLNLSYQFGLEQIKFIGRDLSNIEEVNLYANETLLKGFNSMFRHNKSLNIRSFTVCFDALGSDASFSHMKSLKSLTITNKFFDRDIHISHSAFLGLTNLESLKLDFSNGKILNEANSTGI